MQRSAAAAGDGLHIGGQRSGATHRCLTGTFSWASHWLVIAGFSLVAVSSLQGGVATMMVIFVNWLFELPTCRLPTSHPASLPGGYRGYLESGPGLLSFSSRSPELSQSIRNAGPVPLVPLCPTFATVDQSLD